MWHRLNFSLLLSDTIWSDTRYWQSYNMTVKFWEITIRNWIVKIPFGVQRYPKVWHPLNFRHLLSDMIWFDTRYWQSYTKTVKYWEITIKNCIVKMPFGVLAIPGITWRYLMIPTVFEKNWRFWRNLSCLVCVPTSLLHYRIYYDHKKFHNVWPRS